MKQLTVSAAAVRHNIELVRQRAGSAAVYAVLKGDGYGLGLLEMASAARSGGITRYAVLELEDAVLLRENGFAEEEILMLRSTTEASYLEALIDYSLVGTIGSQEVALALSGICERKGAVAEAHIEIDTGMGRHGFLPSEAGVLINIYKSMNNIALTGIYTHFARAYGGKTHTQKQLAEFNSVLEKLHSAAIEPGLCHAANSSALFNYDFANLDAVRVGSALTGRIATRKNYGLQRAGYIEAAVCETRWLNKKCTVGYGGAFKTRKPRRIAILPVGYTDGYMAEKSRDSYRFIDVLRYCASAVKRGLFNRHTYVTIGGARARVIGHVGMSHTVIDVTDVDCGAGDIARFDINPLFTHGLKRVWL